MTSNSKETSRTLKAGTARVEITTEDPSTRVCDPLFAKALVLDDGATRMAIVTVDVVAVGGICDVGDDFLPALRMGIEKTTGIPGDHVLVNASHTHPPGRIICQDKVLLDRVHGTVCQAATDLEVVRVGAGVGHESRVTVNRTLRMKDGSHWSVRHTNPSPPDDQVAAVGPTDPQIGVLRFDRADGSPLALIYNFACHPLFGDPAGGVTANFVGVASSCIEAMLGHGATALFLQGAAGDVIDVDFKDFETPRDTEAIGHRLAIATLNASREIQPVDATLGLHTETIELPRRTDFPQRMAELVSEQDELLASLRYTALDFKSFVPLYLKQAIDPAHPGHAGWRYLQAEKIGSDLLTSMDTLNRENVEKYLANIRAMERLARLQDKIATLKRHQNFNVTAGSSTVSAEVMGVRVGNAILVTSTTEVLTEVALNIKRSSPCPYTFIAAFTNGYIHYGPPAGDYDKGGYEVTECFLAPDWQVIFEAKAAEIIDRLLA